MIDTGNVYKKAPRIPLNLYTEIMDENENPKINPLYISNIMIIGIPIIEIPSNHIPMHNKPFEYMEFFNAANVSILLLLIELKKLLIDSVRISLLELFKNNGYIAPINIPNATNSASIL